MTTGTETTTSHVTSYGTPLWTPATPITTESIVTFTTETAPATISFPTQMLWLQTGWLYLALAVVVVAVIAVVLARKASVPANEKDLVLLAVCPRNERR